MLLFHRSCNVLTLNALQKVAFRLPKSRLLRARLPLFARRNAASCIFVSHPHLAACLPSYDVEVLQRVSYSVVVNACCYIIGHGLDFVGGVAHGYAHARRGDDGLVVAAVAEGHRL